MFKKLLIVFVSLLVIATGLLYATGHSYILTAISRTYLAGHKTANIDDYQQFDTRVIEHGSAQPWPTHPQAIGDALPDSLVRYLSANKAAAFLVVLDGQLYAERYFAPYNERSKTNSFSMAKTITTLLLGAAVEDGIIDSLETRATQWLPELSGDPVANDVTVRMLSGMTSGFDWDEHYYSPFSPTVALLYSQDVGEFLLRRSFVHAADTTFYYSSASTQLLTMILARALEASEPGLTVSDYLSRKFWQPLGMNDSAPWHLDGTGMELGYCCISTNARNFARFGQLLLQDGQWQSAQLIDRTFVNAMRTPGTVPVYGLSTWIDNDAALPHYAMRGHLGQYVVVVPSKKLVIVRLGQQAPTDRSLEGELLPYYISEVLKVMPN